MFFLGFELPFPLHISTYLFEDLPLPSKFSCHLSRDISWPPIPSILLLTLSHAHDSTVSLNSLWSHCLHGFHLQDYTACASYSALHTLGIQYVFVGLNVLELIKLCRIQLVGVIFEQKSPR